MSEVIHGQDVYLSARVGNDYYIIGCAISATFNFTNDLIGKTDVNAGLFKKYRARISDCKASVNGVIKHNSNDSILSSFYFLQEGIRRSEVDYRFEWYSASGYQQLNMTGIIESITKDADVNDFALFDMSMQGTGNITLAEIIGPPPTGNSEPTDVLSDWWETLEGQYSIPAGPSAIHGYNILGKEIIEVDREGTQYDLITSGSPSGRQCKFDNGLEQLFFDSTLPFNAGETVFIIFKEP